METRFRTKPDCGSRAGYDYHVRQAKELPCEECVNALREHWRNQRKIRRDAINANKRKWRAAHPELQRANTNAIRRRKGKGDWTIEQALELYGTQCHICNKDIDLTAPIQVGAPGWETALHLDHLIPLSKGGADTLENVRPAHAQCNVRKWATI